MAHPTSILARPADSEADHSQNPFMSKEPDASPGTQDVSFGVELEFLVAFVRGDEPDPAAGPGRAALPELVRLAGHDDGRESIPRLLRRCLAREGVPCAAWDARAGGERDDGFRTWHVGTDPSVWEARGFGGYRWRAVEVRSPAAWATGAAFAHVHRVVGLLARRFRVRVNETCGLHVHVGAGRGARLQDAAVKRLAALCWAADGVLASVHAPGRLKRMWARSIREESRLVVKDYSPAFHNFGIDEKEEAVRKEVEEEERASAAGGSAVADLIDLPPRAPDTSRRSQERIPWSQPRHDFLPAVGTLEGVAALLGAPDSYRAADLLCPPSGSSARLNYNFAGLGSWAPRQRTLEVRQAAGSMDPLWVAVWARICARLAEFSLRAPGEAFRRVVLRVAAAEARRDYDVVDLLRDLGMAGEALYVETRLRCDRERFHTPCVLNVGGGGSESESESEPSTERPGSSSLPLLELPGSGSLPAASEAQRHGQGSSSSSSSGDSFHSASSDLQPLVQSRSP